MKLNRVVCGAAAVLALQAIATTTKASDQAAIIQRLDALEKENAALKQRLNRMENQGATSRPAAPRAASGRLPPPAPPGRPAGLETLGGATMVMAADAQDNPSPQVYKSQAVDIATWNRPPRFEVSGSLLFLQPGAGNLEYATLVTPLPVPSPDWANQALSPNFSPAFRVGLRYIPNEANDIQLNWTHLNTTDTASVSASPSQMVGPPYEIGPDAAVYKIAYGSVNSAYDSVNLDAGHTFCADCPFQLRVFGGAEFARVGQTLTGMFQNTDGSITAANTTDSLFTGAGPRVGMKGQYAAGNFQFFGELAGAGLIGVTQSRIDFSATSPLLSGLGITPPNNQSLTSPNATQVIPSIDARLGTSYTFPPSNYGQFKIEVGYQAAVYVNAVNQYSLTLVEVPPVPETVGVFLRTAEHLQSNFTAQGPYLTGSWQF